MIFKFWLAILIIRDLWEKIIFLKSQIIWAYTVLGKNIQKFIFRKVGSVRLKLFTAFPQMLYIIAAE